jgi:adenine-specific DNA-methyltransferase
LAHDRSGGASTIGRVPPTSATETPEQALERVNSREERYALGQFFTPRPIAELMAEAILEIDPETCLDPGVGGGVLLRAVGPSPKRFGCDIDPAAVELARSSLETQGGELELAHADFLDLDRWPFSVGELDAIIANPPYIRHHNLDLRHKALAKHYSRTFGLTISSLSGSYVYFFLEAIRRLRFGGRLAFITPTEFLDVRYGTALKEALLSWCNIEELIVLEMDELAFDGVLTTSAITIATKRKLVRRRVRMTEARMNGAIVRGRKVRLDRDEIRADAPWTPLLPSRAERIGPLIAGRSAKLGDYARVRRGIATGDNSFFCLTEQDVDHWGIESRFLVPVVSGSKDLPENGSTLTRAFWRARKASGAPSWLLWCHQPKSALAGTAVLRYIEHGEALGLPERFNCKARKPWYGVERVPPADFFATYMSRRRARFVRNEAGARCLTSLLNVWANDGIAPDRLRPILEDEANAQLLREFGRIYGGGLGKIEPGDLLRLPVRPLHESSAQAA